MDNIRVGLLGYGLAGRYLHAPFLRAVGGFTLAAVATSRADQVKAHFPDADVSASYDEVIARPDIDLIVITTPHRFHVAQALAALEAGKHVVVEKPVTQSLDELLMLIERARSAGRQLIPYQQRRFDGDFRTVQQLIAAGTLGHIHHFESRWPMYRPRPRGVWRESAEEQGGIFYDLGPHLIDHTLQLFGMPQTVTAQIAANRGVIAVDDMFRLHLGYADGLYVLLEADNLNPYPVPRFAVRGLKGAFIKFGLDPQEGLLRADQSPADASWGQDAPENWGTLYLDTGEFQPSQSPVETLPGDWRLYWQAVHQAITAGAPPPVQASELIAQIQIMAAAHESSRTGMTQRLG